MATNILNRIALAFFLCTTLLLSCANRGKSVSENGDVLYYKQPVTEAEAKKVLSWLHETHHNFGEPKVSFQISKEADKYVFTYPVQIKGAENEKGIDIYIKIFAKQLSAKVLNGAVVEVRLTDEDWKETKRVISSNES